MHIRQIHMKDFNQVLCINSESNPAVARLDIHELHRIVALASVAWVATEGDDLCGYLLAMHSTDHYDGEEFQYFLTALNQPFLYIDQVAVAATYRRKNISSTMYAQLMRRDRELSVTTLCCEVNIRPLNMISLQFHKKIGFNLFREFEALDGRRVALMYKELPYE